ncbi:UDP-glucose--hexose-1-phosphate uridylyltransferase [Paenibacillus pinistramenti]|uniref:UDP-glucose--hexose-1-phosphate uridylyltransferase n=1 Tax=Paenibacillus pinistramenti TaxID=1768003 RepID=UPI0011085299|nr:UDP-glucose--hexose-1-phosphate uridylyltransferase [Paenibacillus pinistramenti]
MQQRTAEAEQLRPQALEAVERLVQFALQRELIGHYDIDYTRNRLLELFKEAEPYLGELRQETLEGPQVLLNTLIDYGFAIGLIPENTDTYRDLLDAEIMGRVTPRPSEVIASFKAAEQEHGIEAATSRFVKLCEDVNYIRMDRVASNLYWEQSTPYGTMEITINLSKPEKSPAEIAAAKLLPPPVYPKCQLCRENVGYAGRINHPARQNLRVIPLALNGEPWFFQYSPYVYYNEHCIVFHQDHVPMKLTKDTFRRLLDFVRQFPHYFIGSNADLPIVGGSILTHDHFQGGKHKFPLEKSPLDAVFQSANHEGVTLGIVNWPMSVLRLNGQDPAVLLEAANDLYELWKGYSDAELGIFAHSEIDGAMVPHNTVTPIVRRSADGAYEIDVVLRNNRTSEEHPEGIYHPHREMHHIKKENIGLIEVMGLAILPGRLKHELDSIARILSGDEELRTAASNGQAPELAAHAEWIHSLLEQHGSAMSKEQADALLRNEVGTKFAEILGHAGVYKRTPEGQQGLRRFVEAAGYKA